MYNNYTTGNLQCSSIIQYRYRLSVLSVCIESYETDKISVLPVDLKHWKVYKNKKLSLINELIEES